MRDKLLSIIIPYYNETGAELFPLLCSISCQAGISFEDIECILINDGNNNILTEGFLSLFDIISPRVIYLPENKGSGLARQAGLDNAKGEYVIFCDADDSFQNVLALSAFLGEIKNSRANLIYSGIIIEEYDKASRRSIYIKKDAMIQVLHGKAYNRAWLKDNNIRFHEKLRRHEDTYFNNLAYVICAREEDIKRIDGITYIQRYRPGSLTREADTDYFTASMPELIACSGYLCDEAEARRPERLQSIVVEYILYFYFILHSKKWEALSDGYLREDANRMLKERILSRVNIFDAAPGEMIAAIYDRMRGEFFSGGLEPELLPDWLNRLR